MIVIGLTGRAGAGKNLVASMLPGFMAIGLADPLYAALATMIDEDEALLRDRTTKEMPIDWLGRSPRELLQTLGTDWGRDLVAPDLWVTLCRRRITRLQVDRVVVTDVRFSNEARMIRSLGGEIWQIVRPHAETTPHQHRSEDGIDIELVHRRIANEAGIDDLRYQVEWAFREAIRAAVA